MRKVLSLRHGLVMVPLFSWLITEFSEGAREFQHESLRGLPGVFAASNEKKYQPCVAGPELLRSIDTWERADKEPPTMNVDGQSMTAESAAEILIADCSNDVAAISGMAAALNDTPPFLILWKENLEFMKWWLKNRHQKLGHPPHE